MRIRAGITITTAAVLGILSCILFVLFLQEHSRCTVLRKEKSKLEQNLNIEVDGTRIIQSPDQDVIQQCTFASLSDGQIDNYLFQPPKTKSSQKEYTLLVYLHAMSFNNLEPFYFHNGEKEPIATALKRINPQLGILSCSYRKEKSWGNDLAISDITQNIRTVMQSYPFSKIVFMGASMGGCVALNFAQEAPDDIKSKIIGIIAMESAGDLGKLYKTTSSNEVRSALEEAFCGNPQQVPAVYFRKTVFNNISSMPKTCRIYLLSLNGDQVVPPELQKDLAEAFDTNKIATRFVQIDGSHRLPENKFFVDGYRFVLNEN